MAGIVEALASKRRISQFVSVGIAGATLETVVVAALTIGLAAPALAAKAVGATCSITLMFYLNDRFTFAAHGAAGLSATTARWGRSILVRAVGLSVAFGVLWWLTSATAIAVSIAGADLWPTIANGLGIGVGMGFNYVAESLFTWNVTDSSGRSGTAGPLSGSDD